MNKKTKVTIVCYNCKGNARPLRKCKNLLDYICDQCLPYHGDDGPEIGNQSKIKVEYKEEK